MCPVKISNDSYTSKITRVIYFVVCFTYFIKAKLIIVFKNK